MTASTFRSNVERDVSQDSIKITTTPTSASSAWSWKTILNTCLKRVFGVEVRRFKEEEFVAFSKKGKKWNYAQNGDAWVGGRFEVENYSHGYHGILKQWWEHYNQGSSCMLVSENNKVKAQFQSQYPSWSFVTLDKFDNLGEAVDIHDDLCGDGNQAFAETFDLIICQATLEHTYDPFSAVRNMITMLKPSGVVVIHTHTPSFPYHPYPRDYFRFQLDWFHDIPQFVPSSELVELLACKGHVFSAFRKTEKS